MMLEKTWELGGLLGVPEACAHMTRAQKQATLKTCI